MSKTAVVTGAGSGVGQAIALKLAAQGWKVALLGRRKEALESTVKRGKKHAKQFLVIPCDIGDSTQVAAMAKTVLAKFKSVAVLVNAAGTNIPRRSLAELGEHVGGAALGAGLFAGLGDDVDDGAGLAGTHLRQESLGAVIGAVEVGINDGVVVLQ